MITSCQKTEFEEVMHEQREEQNDKITTGSNFGGDDGAIDDDDDKKENGGTLDESGDLIGKEDLKTDDIKISIKEISDGDEEADGGDDSELN